jgi:hypothetical protein
MSDFYPFLIFLLNIASVSHLLHTCHITHPFSFLDLISLLIFDEKYTL